MLRRRIRYWLEREKRAVQLREEMEAHIREHAAELIAQGVPTGQAYPQARRRFGNLTQTAEDSREVWIVRYWTDLVYDLRFAVRSLRRQPAFAAVAILSATLGIGACSAVFGLVNFAMLRPLPVAEPDRLMSLSGMHTASGRVGSSLSYPEVRDLGTEMKAFEGVAGFFPFLPMGISSNGAPARYWGFLVTANYFDVVKPAFVLGRGFIKGLDDRPGAEAKVVLTHALWQSRFGGDPSIIGRTIQLNKRSATVIGVTGPGFHGTEVAVVTDFFLPMSQISETEFLKHNPRRLTDYGSQWLMAVGRLKSGVTLEQARAELDVFARNLRSRAPDLAEDHGVYAERAGQVMPGLRKIAIPAFLLLLGATGLVLLTACANIANLMLARASARAQEIATRLAIGAGRGRLIRQLLTESLLLAMCGALFGTWLASVAGRALGSFQLPMPVPIDLTVATDYRVALFAALLAAITAAGFGLAPALRATRSDLVSAIKADRRFGMRNVLVAAQVGISTVLLICSALFLRSLAASRSVDTGLDPRSVLLVHFDPALSNYDEPQSVALAQRLLADIRTLPGVRSASISNTVPLSIGGNFTRVEGHRTAVVTATRGYFDSLGIRMREGSDFPDAPSREPLVIVNEALARLLFPNGSALGQQLKDDGRMARVIGVVANSKYQMVQESGHTPILYKPILDNFASEGSFLGLALIAKADGDLASTVRARFAAIDRDLVISDIGTMAQHMEESMLLPRMAAAMFGLCGGMGLLIASIGVYGVISFAVARRSREIGIRMALGARRRHVIALVMKHGAFVSLAGIGIGLACGLGLARVARALIFGVSPADAVTFLGVPLLLLTVALLATALPARRAAAIDPNRTLRAE